MTEFVPPSYEFSYRVTGKQSIERLQPLIENFQNTWLKPISFCESVTTPSSPNPLQFVWETTCEREWKSVHQTAKIINKLYNTNIIESKSNMAYLQLKMKCPSIETFVARNREELVGWIERFYSIPRDKSLDWWVIKASNGNGGKDIWMINQENFTEVIASLPSMEEEYVIQKCVLSGYFMFDVSSLTVFVLDM